MKIAIPYNSGKVFAHFGKAEQFKIYTISDEEIISDEIVAPDLAGHSALTDFLKQHKVNMVICGGIGTHAVLALRDAAIQIMGGASGDADRQVEDFLNGKLHFEEPGTSLCGGGCAAGCSVDADAECDGNLPACASNCHH